MHVKPAFVYLCAVIATALGPVSPSAAQDKGQVVVAAGGGAFQDALREAVFKPFERATRIKVVEAAGPTLPKLRGMVAAGSPEWDVVDMAPADFLVLSSEGTLQRLDYSAIDQSVFADFPKDAVQPFGVGTFEYATVIAFNTKKYTQANGPRSWADVWDVKKFPGPRILNAGNAAVPPIELALLADGIPPEQLYPLDFKRAYVALARIKPSVVKWTTAAAMAPEALISGEAVIGAALHARIQLAKEQGAPVDYIWSQAVADHSYWSILKGAKNVSNAQKFIEFASRPESQAALAKLFVIGPLNKKAFDLIPADRAKLLPTYTENKAKTVAANPAWWAKRDASGKSNLEINNALWSSWSLQP
ncbi:putative spermidine/putrescine transport system substrate-binding protein [Bradyrhizobium macuxiense]|uniref:Putative spermidine/putrescine transport system substrate-binding protein n=1 Tax=Bradyrhizobium macuxiense TaxID=1755647 RepID=A0A560KRZ8_9BRAD|nr:ABC transporter substrate-binding protein [Bradyrhizobium macuxiense]TWB86038.1 putative spermidine/putrescine transport system substrate-binding protein [Bradyrhizobium macuxiense]